MASVIYDVSWQRNRKLRELGCEHEDLIEVVRACVAGRGGCTANDPISAPGYEAWRHGTRRLRERFLPNEGWERSNALGIESVVHRERRIRISVVNTDEATGMLSKSPRNRTRKGCATEAVTDLNGQLELGGPIQRLADALRSEELDTWHLCVFDDGEHVRAELSRPVEFASGHFVKFAERVMVLQNGDWDGLRTDKPDDDAGPDVEISIRRK